MTPTELDAARAALAADLTIDIVTTGRRSGEPRTTEIWFTRVDGSIYICGTPAAGFREREPLPRDWLANLAATPDFDFAFKESVSLSVPARAVVVTDPAERRRVYAHPAASWYLEQTGSLDALVEHAPLVRVEFTGDAAPLNGARG